MKRFLSVLALGAALVAPPLAQAIEYNRIEPAKSRIDFSFTQMGVKVQGHFARFSGRLRLDPANPEAAQVGLDVDLASIDTGSSEGNDEAVGRSWLDVADHPTATFDSTGVKAVGGDRYEVSGRLTIKGRTRDLVVPVDLKAQGSGAVLEGTFAIRRGDFAVGEGEWAKFDVVENAVQIQFRIAVSGN